VSNDSLSPATVEYRIEDTDSHEVVASGSFSAPANQNWQVARLRTFASEQRLYLIHWQVDGIWFGNHYLVGHPPISFEDYRSWLEDIAALPTPFDAATVAK
jgi:hypothetical protein